MRVKASLSLAVWYLVSWEIWLQREGGIAVDEEGADSAPGEGSSGSTSVRRCVHSEYGRQTGKLSSVAVGGAEI